MKITCKKHNYQLLIEENRQRITSVGREGIESGWGFAHTDCEIFSILRYNADEKLFDVMMKGVIEKRKKEEFLCKIEIEET